MMPFETIQHILNQVNANSDIARNQKYHHNVEDIKIRSYGLDMETLVMHRPTINLKIRICDQYQDFDDKYNPYTAYILRICDGGFIWTIKTRYSKLYSFHKSLKYDPSIHNQDCMKDLKFPRKSVIGVINDGFLKKRRRQINKYFKSLTRDILISDIMRQLVIPQNFVF
eukprot:62508_1